MTELIPIQSICNDTLVCDSRIIAKELGIQHRALLQTLKTYEAKIGSRFGQVTFKMDTVTNSVKAKNQIKYALLTEIQATAICALSRNADRVVDVKFALVEAFFKTKQQLQSIHQSSVPQIEAASISSTSSDPTIRHYVETTINALIEVQSIDDLEAVAIKLSQGIHRHKQVYREIERKEASLLLSFFSDDIEANSIENRTAPNLLDQALNRMLSEQSQLKQDGKPLEIEESVVKRVYSDCGIKSSAKEIGAFMYSKGFKALKKNNKHYWIESL